MCGVVECSKKAVYECFVRCCGNQFCESHYKFWVDKCKVSGLEKIDVKVKRIRKRKIEVEFEMSDDEGGENLDEFESMDKELNVESKL